jgi:glucans biosynthesis protein
MVTQVLQSQRFGRRTVLAGAGALMLAPALHRGAVAQPLLPAGEAFSFDALAGQMRAAARTPFVPAPPFDGAGLAASYDDWRRIVWQRARTRWRGDSFGLQAFAPGWLFREPVQLYDVSDGTVRPFPVGPADFERDGRPLPDGAALPGVAGFRLVGPLNRPGQLDEIVAFLGASYFRALGRGSAYGLSARGLALDTLAGAGEEFPRFAAFYLERPAPGAGTLRFHAALDSPRATGAFRFDIRPGDPTLTDVTARLWFRGDVGVLGIGCLTSMHLYDDKNRAAFDDHRPRVHDSEGLGLVTAAGEAIWRPLNNPARAAQSWFGGRARAFGLYQRRRGEGDYADLEARYHRRPSAEVTPLADWGEGAVRLVELPAADETVDNIVAAFVPGDGRVGAGEERACAWRIAWGDLPPDPGALARVTATRAGAGGVPGTARAADVRKFAVDFAGPGLPPPPADPAAPLPVQADLRVQGGDIVKHILEPLPGGVGWRLTFDLRAARGAVAEVAARLTAGGSAVSETWASQWVTPS